MSKYDIYNIGIDIAGELKNIKLLSDKIIEINCKSSLLITIYVDKNTSELDILRMHDSIRDYAYDRLDKVIVPIDLEFVSTDANEVITEFRTIRSELKDWSGNYDTDLVDKVILRWPESQDYMTKPGFSLKASLINDEEGYSKYGPQAFVVEKSDYDFWNSID